MNKAGAKILKVILFVGVFAYLQYHDVNREAFTINSVIAGIMMASAAYLLASLFGIVLSLSKNYLIAIVGTAALALFLAFKIDEVIAKTSWLTEGRAAAFLGGFAIICLVGDIRTVKRSLAASDMVMECGSIITPNDNDPNVTMRNNMKANPQSVLNLSNMLEKKWGHKPTYQEVMDYIDHLAVPEDDLI